MWTLKVSTEGLPEKTFRILPGTVRTVGRSTGADFIVDAALVSRVHCRLTALADGGLEVSDLESTNGTYVNGDRVERALLSPGDRIRVGLGVRPRCLAGRAALEISLLARRRSSQRGAALAIPAGARKDFAARSRSVVNFCLTCKLPVLM